MSNDQTKQRLLKANNVQRRRFEKIADEVICRGRTKSRNDITSQKAIVYNQHVQKAMGAELSKLLVIRRQVQEKKLEIQALQESAEPIRRRLNKRGVKAIGGNNYRNDFGYLEFYLDPPAEDVKNEDVCQVIVGNPLVQLRLMDCQNNKPYADYTEAISKLVVDEQAYTDACEQLRSDIWSVVSTEDITAKIDAFKKLWL